jgi:hypothetical protein
MEAVALRKKPGRRRYAKPVGRVPATGMILLRQFVNSLDMTIEEFATEMNVPKSNLYYWMKNGAFYQEAEGRRRIILPRVVSEVSL